MNKKKLNISLISLGVFFFLCYFIYYLLISLGNRALQDGAMGIVFFLLMFLSCVFLAAGLINFINLALWAKILIGIFLAFLVYLFQQIILISVEYIFFPHWA